MKLAYEKSYGSENSVWPQVAKCGLAPLLTRLFNHDTEHFLLIPSSIRFTDMNNNGKIIVQWVTPTGNTVLQQLEVPFMGATKDRLPLKAIREKWQCGPITWLDVEEVLEQDSNGYSTMSFRGMENIRVTTTKNK